MSDRGVSDVVGFILTFSIIIFSVAIVSTVGISQLSELSDREQVNSAERAMESFAGTLDDVSRHGDVARRATLSPSGGTVWFNDSTLSVAVVDSGGGLMSDERIQINSLEHRFTRNPEDVSVAYEGGAVYRSDGAVALVRPQWRCSPGSNTATVTVVNLTAGDGLGIGSGFGSDSSDSISSGGREIVGGGVESADRGLDFVAVRDPEKSKLVHTTEVPDVTVSVDLSETANPSQWAFHLERRGGWTAAGGHTYECANVETVVVRVVTVELSA